MGALNRLTIALNAASAKDQAKDDKGRFTISSTGSKISSGGARLPGQRPRRDATGSILATTREGGAGQTPTALLDPRTGQPLSKTASGDIYEELLARKATKLDAIMGGPIQSAAGVGQLQRNVPIDVVWGTHGVEVKTISDEAASQKSAIRGASRDKKLAACEELDLTPATIIQRVSNTPTGVHVDVFLHRGDYVSRSYKSLGDGKVASYNATVGEWNKAAIARGVPLSATESIPIDAYYEYRLNPVTGEPEMRLVYPSRTEPVT